VVHLVTHIAWLGKKSPFCGNVTYGLTITEALRNRGHRISFIHFDTPASFPLRRDDSDNPFMPWQTASPAAASANSAANSLTTGLATGLTNGLTTALNTGLSGFNAKSGSNFQGGSRFRAAVNSLGAASSKSGEGSLSGTSSQAGISSRANSNLRSGSNSQANTNFESGANAESATGRLAPVDAQQTGDAAQTAEALAKAEALANPEVALTYLMKSQVYTVPAPGAQRELRESLERLRPDVVHASLTLSPLDFLLPDLCEQLGLPLVATFHPAFDAGLRNLTAGTTQLMYQLYAPSLAHYDRVIVFSELQAELLNRLGVKENRLAVIPNGVDPQQWAPAGLEQPSVSQELAALQRQFGNERIFLYMGRIAPEKNVEALLKAWRLVQLPGCRLVVVGDGTMRQQLMQSYGEDDRVLWWGHEPDRLRRLALLQLAEVFILPSLVEGLSLALLEAMASGTACIATDAGADGEVLEGGAGIVISTQAVTTQLRTLLPVLRDQPVLSAELGRRARARVLERYSLSHNIDALEKLYGQLLNPGELVG
jgi:glycosyltransferase involved in cell wall biosynthesis